MGYYAAYLRCPDDGTLACAELERFPKQGLSHTPAVQEGILAISLLPAGDAPLRPVLTICGFYESQPARVLPYITRTFRGGMEPRLWVDQTVRSWRRKLYASGVDSASPLS